MVRKSSKTKQNSQWYIWYGFSALLIVAGFFYMMNYYATSPSEITGAVENIDIKFETTEDVLLQHYTPAKMPETDQPMIWPLILVSVGIAGFLYTKYRYEIKR